LVISAGIRDDSAEKDPEGEGAAHEVGGQRTIRPTRSPVASCVQRKPVSVLNEVQFRLDTSGLSGHI